MNGFLSNDWMVWFWQTYSIVITVVPSAVAFLLKLIALWNPNIQSDKVIDLMKEYWPKGKA